jgi:hypothetical protein
MLSIKRLSVALIALGLSAPVLANNMVCVPSQHGGFKVVVDALYLRNNAVNDMSASTYNWGIYSQIGYLFPATGNDLTVGYTYIRSDNKASMNLDTVDLDAGQRLTTGAFDMRLFAGFRYTHLDYVLDINTEKNEQYENSKFHGFGPKFGTDARYQLGNCFGLDAHVNTALLVGTLSGVSETINHIIPGSELKQDKGNRLSESINHVVPQLEAKLGIDYTSPLSVDNKSAFVFEVGYQTTHSFHSIDNNIVNGSSDVSFDGPYLDVKYYA